MNVAIDKSRLENYLQLIQGLLDYPSQDISDILNINKHLVDIGLIKTIKEVVEEFEQRGKRDPAYFLMDIVSQLEDKLGIGTAARKTQLDFLKEALRTTKYSQGNSQMVYLLLENNLDKLDDNFASLMGNWAKTKLSEVDNEIGFSIVKVISNFSNLIQQFSLGNRAVNLEIAITGYEIALATFSRKYYPVEWAMTQNNLGVVYSDRLKGDKGDNIEVAINCYQAALEEYTRDRHPQKWAITQNNLGAAYFERLKGDRSENIQTAIKHYKTALEEYTRDEYPQEWEMTQSNLEEAYGARLKVSHFG
jgi:tetratricopeptide (TPR) repeat protein